MHIYICLLASSLYFRNLFATNFNFKCFAMLLADRKASFLKWYTYDHTGQLRKLLSNMNLSYSFLCLLKVY